MPKWRAAGHRSPDCSQLPFYVTVGAAGRGKYVHFKPKDPNFEQRVRDSFREQRIMALIGADVGSVKAGRVEIRLPYREDLTQQDGFLHAGIVATVVDSACGYAAYTLMAADSRVLSVEFKINLMAPARCDVLIARGEVMRPGKTLTICRGEAVALTDDTEKRVALMQATMIALRESD